MDYAANSGMASFLQQFAQNLLSTYEQKKQEQDLKKLKEDEVKINVDGEKKTKDEEKLF